jgi:hypothetical protein
MYMKVLSGATVALVLLPAAAHAFLAGQPGGSGRGAYTDQRGCCVSTGGDGGPTYTGVPVLHGQMPTGRQPRFPSMRIPHDVPNTGGVAPGNHRSDDDAGNNVSNR